MSELALDEATREQLWNIYSEGKSLLQLIAFLLIALAFFMAVARIGKIAQVMKDFLAARGPIWDFQKTVADLKELEPAIKSLSDPVSLLAEKIDAAQKQIAELQRHSISERTAEASQETQPALQRAVEESDKNWERLREFWARNTERIEAVIDAIKDGRKRLRYDRLPRYAYRPIIDQLAKDGRITAASANASLELLDIFNQYRPRNRTVPDEVIGALEVLDRQLEAELVPLSQQEADPLKKVEAPALLISVPPAVEEDLRVGS